MIHGMIEGRLCHYIHADGEHAAGLMVGVDKRSNASRVNVFVPPRSIEEVEAVVKSVVTVGDSVVVAVTKVFASFIKESVPFMPSGKNAPCSWHFVEKAD